MSLGDRASAVASLRKAEVLLDDLAARYPSSDAAIFHAALPCYFARVEPETAAEHARQCLKAVEPFAVEYPANGYVREVLGQAHLRLAETGSEEHARAAIDVLSQPVDASYDSRFATLLLAYAHRQLGWRLFDRGEMQQALIQGETAAAILAPIVEASGALERRMDYAFTLQLIGRSAAALRDEARARAALEHALRIIESSYRDSPMDAFIQDRLASSYRYLALALEDLGDHQAAAEVYRAGVERLTALTLVLDEPTRDWTRGALYAGHALLNFSIPPCDLLRQANEHLEAARALGQLPRPQRAAQVVAALAGCDENAR